MTKKEKAIHLHNFLDEYYPNVKCELNYTKDYELVIAVMLSAQTTDIAVNNVTSILFSKYDTLEKMANADIKDIENIIRSIGLYKNKAKNVKAIANMILNQYDGKVPFDKNELQQLPGVGNKTAGVVRVEIFKIPDLPVDTHILRIAYRLGLSNKEDEAIDVEHKLKKLFDKSIWIKTHHQLIHFGRDMCDARSPKCQNCKLTDFCKDFH